MSPASDFQLSKPRVGYVLKMFPRLSETFIMNELLELERQGVELSVFSLMHPNDGRFHGRLSALKLTAKYFPSQKPEVYWNAVHNLPERLGTPMERWPEAVELLRRYDTPRDLEFLLRAVAIAGAVRDAGVGHLHAHFATIATRMAMTVSLMTGVPFSFTAHAKDIFRETVDRTLFAELVERAAFCVTVSDFNREFILEHTPHVNADKILRLYNGVDLSALEPPVDRTTPDVPHIVSVGRLVPKKGFDHLLRSLRLARDRGLRFRATIAGDGEEMAALTRLRQELGLEAEVAFPGAMAHERVSDLLREATLFALACVPDGDGNMDALPTVLLEALALDLPVVSTRLTGIPEIVGTEAGVLCEPGDDDTFAAAVCAMWERIKRGTQPRGVCRERAESRFDLARNVAVLRGLFERSVVGRMVA
jgi:glycosyltransferase involved in cell wall biosynthesis